jgi:hypothetical protein
MSSIQQPYAFELASAEDAAAYAEAASCSEFDFNAAVAQLSCAALTCPMADVARDIDAIDALWPAPGSSNDSGATSASSTPGLSVMVQCVFVNRSGSKVWTLPTLYEHVGTMHMSAQLVIHEVGVWATLAGIRSQSCVPWQQFIHQARQWAAKCNAATRLLTQWVDATTLQLETVQQIHCAVSAAITEFSELYYYAVNAMSIGTTSAQ